MSDEKTFIITAEENGRPVQLSAGGRETADRLAKDLKEQGLAKVEVLDCKRD